MYKDYKFTTYFIINIMQLLIALNVKMTDTIIDSSNFVTLFYTGPKNHSSKYTGFRECKKLNNI